MKTNKFLLTTGVGLLLLVLVAGCKKELNEVGPQSSLDPNLVLTDPAAANTLYFGVYAAFRSYQSVFFQLGEARSDIWADGLFTESADGTMAQYNSHNISALNVPAGNWGGLYTLLNRINNVIKIFPNTTIDNATKNRELAEMYGMRAYVYYTLLRTWGRVPITTEPMTSIGDLSQLYKPRSTADSVLMLIKDDINQSLTLFAGNNGVSPVSSKRVFWNRAASLTLKGEVYLWSGTNMGGGNTDIGTAKSALEEAAGISANFGLQANFADVFDPTKEAGNKEIIFAISYEKDQSTLTYFPGIFSVNTTQASTLLFDAVPGPGVSVSTTYPFVAGANRVGLSAAMLARINNPLDKRMKVSFRPLHSNVSPFAIRGVMLTKFIGRVDAGAQLYDNDFPIYRFADVLLMLAEAKAKLGVDPSGEINLIRARAYGTGYVPYANSTLSDNLNAILEENLREFIGEGKRWWALRRAGDSYVYANIKPAYLSPTSTAKLLLPISVSMMNGDPTLTQTEGY